MTPQEQIANLRAYKVLVEMEESKTAVCDLAEKGLLTDDERHAEQAVIKAADNLVYCIDQGRSAVPTGHARAALKVAVDRLREVRKATP